MRCGPAPAFLAASRAASSVANGFWGVPAFASSPLGATWNSTEFAARTRQLMPHTINVAKPAQRKAFIGILNGSSHFTCQKQRAA
jgi:hypothetical protein